MKFTLVFWTWLSVVNCLPEITVYDARYLWNMGSYSECHEHMQLLAAVGGLVNRDARRLFVQATAADEDWFNFLRAPGQWLEFAEVTYETSILNLVSKYQNEFRGVILFDGSVPSTSNIASSIAGVENLLPILAGGSLYPLICESGVMLPVRQSLVGLFDGSETGSAKNDAYQWFLRRYMSPSNRTEINPAVHGYFMASSYIVNISCDQQIFVSYILHLLFYSTEYLKTFFINCFQ